MRVKHKGKDCQASHRWSTEAILYFTNYSGAADWKVHAEILKVLACRLCLQFYPVYIERKRGNGNAFASEKSTRCILLVHKQQWYDRTWLHETPLDSICLLRVSDFWLRCPTKHKIFGNEERCLVYNVCIFSVYLQLRATRLHTVPLKIT